MDNYSKTVLLDDHISSNIRNKCTNSIEQCAYYASKGMCETSTIFMMNNCPLACMMCESLEEFHALVGKLHPFENPIFVKDEIFDYIDHPEEINAFSLGSFFNFTRKNHKDNIQVISQPTFQQQEPPDTDSDDPLIVIVNDFLSESECDRLVQLGHDIGWKNSSSVSKLDHFNGLHSFQIPLRSSQSLICDNNNNSSLCATTFQSLIEKLSQFLHIPQDYFEVPQMDRYPTGGYYSLHHDYRIPDTFRPAGPRILSVYLVLSEATSGGLIGFPDLDFLLVRPKRGSIMLLSNIQGGDLSLNSRSRKEIMPVREGDLYLVHTHVHLFSTRNNQFHAY
jgi:ShK domain-like.